MRHLERDLQKLEFAILKAGPPRFELGQREPKSLVLPLHHGPKSQKRMMG